jgi:glycosyltransferase involved in cell wall biosynthesis
MLKHQNSDSVAGKRWHICVIVPARNEEKLLPRCLISLIEAKRKLPVTVRCEILVALDSSTDGSPTICEDLLQKHGRSIVINEGSVGHARAAAACAALHSYSGPLEKCWLANTDADCVVPGDWLMRQIEHAGNGFEAVAGIIDVDNFSEHSPHVKERFRATYLAGYEGSHPHIHGANLGVRADAYVKAGGWPLLETAEDHGIWHQLRLTNAKTCSDSSLIVATSGRRVGRAPHGFAEALAAHNALSEGIHVLNPAPGV